MTRRKDGLFEVQYIGDDAAPKEPRPAATIAELRTALDSAIVAHYGSKLPTAGMSVGYAIYPWRETKVPKALAREIGGTISYSMSRRQMAASRRAIRRRVWQPRQTR